MGGAGVVPPPRLESGDRETLEKNGIAKEKRIAFVCM